MFTRTCVAAGVIYPNEWRPRGKVANVAIRRGELWPLARLLGNGNLRSFWQTGGDSGKTEREVCRPAAGRVGSLSLLYQVERRRASDPPSLKV